MNLLLVPLDLADIGNTLLTPFYWVISGLLVFFQTLLSPVFGSDSGITWTLAIVSITVVIRSLTIPLYVKQIKSTRSMQALQPQVSALREKFKGDNEKLGRETQRIYEENGVNPMASCLPALAQMPVFLGLFWVLNGAARGEPKGQWLVDRPELVSSLQNAEIFGAKLSGRFLPVTDVGATQVVALVLTAFLMASLFGQQLMMMKRNMQPSALEGPLGQQQKTMLFVFPLMYAVSGVSIPIGVLLYWATSNLWTFVQQWIVIRRYPTPGTPAFLDWEDRMIAKGKDPKAMEEARMEKIRAKRRPAAPPVQPSETQAQSAPATVQRQNVPARQIVRKDADGNKTVIQRQQPKVQSRAKRKKN